MKIQFTLFYCACLFLAFTQPPAHADWGEHLKNGEKKGMSVPSYCKAKFPSSFPEITKQQEAAAKQYLGGSFLHVHHFCLGLVHIWNMETEGKVPNTFIANQTLKEITYFSSRTPQDHPIMRDVHRAYAKAYRYLGDDTKSREHYDMALKVTGSPRTSTTPPAVGGSISASADRYVQMADKMIQLGLPGEAAELLELARQLEPKSRLIQHKLQAAKAAAQADATEAAQP